MKKLLVMVSIYNSGTWIENRLANLLDCTCINDMEVWCINANSPDNTDDTIPRKFPFHYEKLPKRISVYETWNYILQNAPPTDCVTNANTDDIVAPECYEKLMQPLRNNNNGLAYCSWFTTAKNNLIWKEKHHIDPAGKPGQYSGDLQRGGVGHFPLWKRELHNTLGFFDTQFKALSDADWWARVYYMGRKQLIWVNELLAIYLWRKGENLWNREITPNEWAIYHKKVKEYREKSNR